MRGSIKNGTRNGQLHVKIVYDNGTPVGDAFTWYEDGNPRTQITSVNGKAHGEYIKWNEEWNYRTKRFIC